MPLSKKLFSYIFFIQRNTFLLLILPLKMSVTMDDVGCGVLLYSDKVAAEGFMKYVS